MKKYLGSAGFFLIIGSLLSLTSCDNRIPEDTETTNIIDDKYRNYYEIFVGSFYDSDGDGMGDLNGVRAKLDYIADLGYNGIWLMPIFESPTYHKYDASDYFTIDPDYGTMDDLINLINECHAKDINIILDLAVNHSSFDNEWFIESAAAYNKYLKGETLTEEENNMKDLYAFKEDGTSVNGRIYTQVSGYSFYVEENFSGGGMPEFNYESEYTMELIKTIFIYYLDLGVDGFRLDAVKYLAYNDTNRCIEILNELYNYAKTINEDVYMVGECWDNVSLISTYYTSELDSYFNFNTSVSASGGSFISRSINLDGSLKELYLTGAKTNLEMANGKVPAPFLDNHDMSRVARSSSDQTKFFYGLLSMLNGATFTYYGDEIGLNGTVSPDQDVRCHMYWSDKDLTGITNDPDGGEANYIHDPVDTQLKDENSILNYYKKANLLRNQNPEIARGEILDTSYSDSDTGILVMNKSYEDSEISIVINFSSSNSYTYNLDLDEEVIGQLVVDVDNYMTLEENVLSLPPLSIAIVK